MKVLLNLEHRLLNYLNPETSNKLLNLIKGWVDTRKKMLLSKHLNYKLDKFLEANPENKDLTEPLLRNQIKFILAGNSLSSHNRSIDDNLSFDIAARNVKTYAALRGIVAVQPIAAPVGQVYLMKFEESGEPNANGLVVKTLKLVSNAVEAKTRKFRASYSLEAYTDLKNAHGLDISVEITNLVGDMTGDEVVSQVLTDLVNTADVIKPLEIIQGWRDMTNKLAVMLTEAENDIARKTHRGSGNFIVVSPETLVRIPLEAFKIEGTSLLTKVGTIKDSNTDVYVSTVPELTNKVLVGYKGKNGECDAGYVVAPYIPVMAGLPSTPVDTFTPTVPFYTRIGIHKVDNVADYYRVIDLSELETPEVLLG